MRTITKRSDNSVQRHDPTRAAFYRELIHDAFYNEPSAALSPATCRMVIIDSVGTIVAANKAWWTLAVETGTELSRVGPGVNYLKVCQRACSSSGDAAAALQGIRSLLSQKASRFAMDYTCSAPSGPRYYRMEVTPMIGESHQLCVAHMDITDFQLAQQKQTSGASEVLRSTIRAQEEERKQISQGMHDRLSNAVALLALSVREAVKHIPENGKSRRELEKVLSQITDLAGGMRATSHSIYPLTLQYVGLKGILRVLQDTFEKMYGIRVKLTLPEELPRISDDVALCIFRVAQQCLQNLAESAGSHEVALSLGCKLGSLRLSISTDSESLRAAKSGFAAMESRASAVGGKLIVNRLGSGTEIQLRVPL